MRTKIFSTKAGTATSASLILLSFLFTVSGQRASRSRRPGMDLQRVAKISAQMKSFVSQGSVAGAVTLIAQHGRVVSLEAYGYHDLKSKKDRLDLRRQIGD